MTLPGLLVTSNDQGWFVGSRIESPGTLPETNMAPENTPLEKEIPIGNHHFWVLC